MVRYLRDAHVADLVTTEDANRVMEELFINDAEGKVVACPNLLLPGPSAETRGVSVKVGADYESGVFGYKVYPGGPRGSTGSFLIVLYDVELGLSAMVEGQLITQLRTGAIGAIGTKFLARDDASKLGIIGTGREARTQLRSTVLVRDFTRVLCYSRSAKNRDGFASEMSHELGIDVVPCGTAEECVREADVVTTITSSREPVLFGEWLREGTHINAVGATRPNRRELDEEAVARCETIVVETKQGATEEIGELIYAVERGKLDWDDVHELKEAVSGSLKRNNPNEITLNDTVGIGAEDVALAWFAVNRAEEAGIGRELDFDSI